MSDGAGRIAVALVLLVVIGAVVVWITKSGALSRTPSAPAAVLATPVEMVDNVSG